MRVGDGAPPHRGMLTDRRGAVSLGAVPLSERGTVRRGNLRLPGERNASSRRGETCGMLVRQRTRSTIENLIKRLNFGH